MEKLVDSGKARLIGETASLIISRFRGNETFIQLRLTCTLYLSRDVEFQYPQNETDPSQR